MANTRRQQQQEQEQKESKTRPVTIDSMSELEVYEFVSQFKAYIDRNPQDAKQVLMEYPQLTKVLALGQFRLRMHDHQADMMDIIDQEEDDILNTFVNPEQQELLAQVKELTAADLRILTRPEQEQIQDLRKAMGLPRLNL